MEPNFEPLKVSSLRPRPKAEPRPKASAAAVPDFFALLDDERPQPPRAAPKRSAGRTGSVASGAGGKTEGGSTRESAWEELLASLGLPSVNVEEDPLADPVLMDGLREVLGGEALQDAVDAILELEEEQAEQPGDVANITGDVEPDDGEGEGQDGDGAPPPEPPLGGVVAAVMASALESPAPPPEAIPASQSAPAAPPPIQMCGLEVRPTGFNSGLVANVFASGAASSTGPPSMQRVGVLHRVNEFGLKMTCKVHKDCVCWITCRNRSLMDVQNDLVAWLARAASNREPVSADEHGRLSRDLKVAHGMKVRKR